MRARVIWETATGTHWDIELREIGKDQAPQFAAIAQRVRTMEDQYSDLWTFWVAMDRSHLGKAANVVEHSRKRLAFSATRCSVTLTFEHS